MTATIPKSSDRHDVHDGAPQADGVDAEQLGPHQVDDHHDPGGDAGQPAAADPRAGRAPRDRQAQGVRRRRTAARAAPPGRRAARVAAGRDLDAVDDPRVGAGQRRRRRVVLDGQVRRHRAARRRASSSASTRTGAAPRPCRRSLTRLLATCQRGSRRRSRRSPCTPASAAAGELAQCGGEDVALPLTDCAMRTGRVGRRGSDLALALAGQQLRR